MKMKVNVVNEEQLMNKGQKENDKMVHLKSILPPFNYSATKPENIYKLEDIIFHEEEINTEYMDRAIESIQAGEGIYF